MEREEFYSFDYIGLISFLIPSNEGFTVLDECRFCIDVFLESRSLLNPIPKE